MIKNPALKSGDAYTEVFDMARLLEIAELSKKYTTSCALSDETRISSALMEGVPNGHFSDFEVNVWQLMNSLIRYGRYDIPLTIHLRSIEKEAV